MKVNILLFDDQRHAVVRDVELADAATLIDWTTKDEDKLLNDLNLLTRRNKVAFTERSLASGSGYSADAALTEQEILIAHSVALDQWFYGPTRVDFYHDMSSSKRNGSVQRNLKTINQKIKLVWFVEGDEAVKTYLNLEKNHFEIERDRRFFKPWGNIKHNCVGCYEHPDDSEGVIYDETGEKLPNTFVFV